MAETPLEFHVRAAERGFRVHIQVPGVVDDGEQQVSQLLRNRLSVPRFPVFLRLRHGLPEFDDLFLDLGDDVVRRGPVEPDPRRALLQLSRPQQGGESVCDVVEDAGPASFRTGARLPFPRLVDLPRQRLCRGVRDVDVAVAEDVGMPADHLVADSVHDAAEIEAARFARHLRVEDDLKEQVPELVAQTLHVTVLDRVRDLVGLFDGVRRDGLEGLLEVPGAPAVRIAKPGHDVEKPANVSGLGGGVHGAIIGAGPEARNHDPFQPLRYRAGISTESYLSHNVYYRK